MAQLDQNLSDSQLVMQAHQFIADLTEEMKSIAVFLSPEEEEQVKAAFSQRSKPTIIETRDAVPWDATNKADPDTTWDWPSADQRLRKWSGVDGDNPTAAQWAKYEQAFAWFDPTSSDTFAGYKLPHHDIIDGKLSVVIKGVQAAMGALNGARGGTTIPGKDQDGVYQHLVKHYHQFGITPPDQARSGNNPQIERRTASFSLEPGNTLVGRAAAFNAWTTINTRQGSFHESIKPGAFRNIANCNVRALLNHDPNAILGSTQAGNLQLRQTNDGLDFSLKLLPTQLSKDVYTLVKNKVINSCSFAWDGSTSTDEWNGDKRTLVDIPDVVDVSIVTYPAYADVTHVDVRSKILQAKKPDLWKYSLAIKNMSFFEE